MTDPIDDRKAHKAWVDQQAEDPHRLEGHDPDWHHRQAEAAQMRRFLILEERAAFGLPMSSEDRATLDRITDQLNAHHRQAASIDRVAADNDELAARQRAIRERQERP